MEQRLLVYYLAGVPLLGMIAQWLASRMRVPSILLLLGFGIALGQFLKPDDVLAYLAGGDASVGPKLLFPVVTLSVAIILFEGGLTLRFRELRESGPGVLRLVTVGAAVSWLLSGLAAWWLLGFEPAVAALLGAILVVTGPTVVGPMLRQIRPKRRVGSIVKWEGIVIDPIGAVLAVLVFEIVFSAGGELHAGEALLSLGRTALAGLLLGGVTSWLMVALMRRYWLPDELHGLAFLSVTLAVFAISNWMQPESGLVTVTVLGIMLANQRKVVIRHVVEFKEHLGVLLISCLFIVLGSRLELSEIWELGWGGFGFVAAMILVVRPASVMLSLLGDQTTWRERLFLSFIAPRGIVAAAVSSVFALRLGAYTVAGADSTELWLQAERLIPVTFLVIVSTVTFYGLLAGPLARWLGLADSNPQGVLFAGAQPWVQTAARLLQEAGIQVMLVDTNFRRVAEARMAGLRAECASILSIYVHEELDLAGLGRLLALTPNEEVNTLAVREMQRLFGRGHVYQLASDGSTSARRQSVGEHLRGRQMFQKGLSAEELERRIAAGAVIKKTQLGDAFSYIDFQKRYGPSAILMFVITRKKNLSVCAPDKTPSPERGDTLIALVPGETKS